jgi:hypothetical protein
MEQKDVQEPVTLLSPTAILDARRTRAQDHQRSLVGEIIWALRQSITQHEQERTN